MRNVEITYFNTETPKTLKNNITRRPACPKTEKKK